MKKMFITTLSGSLIGILYGCANVSVCPHFPPPSQRVLGKIKEINDPETDAWMTDMFKLNKKLKFCRGE